MASVTVNLTGADTGADFVIWNDNVSLGSTFDESGAIQTLSFLSLVGSEVNISILGTNNVFTNAFETSGRIIIEASDGETLEVMIANADISEPYQWTPVNSADVIMFVAHVLGLTDRNATLTLTDDDPAVAPSFADDTGDAQTWTQNTAITDITVPEADGDPPPTYAVEGSLPAGIAFDTTTRVISGTPTATGSGTITIRATNSAGDADWTVDYTITAAPPPDLMPTAPNVADQSGVVGTAVDITLAVGTGGDAPLSYSITNLPAGLAAADRRITGTPTTVQTQTVTYTVEDDDGDTDSTTFDFVITAAAPTDTAPSRPAAPTLTVNSDTEITAVGIEPDDGGDTIINYDWRHRITSPLGAWVSRSNVSNLTQAFTGLEPATPYRFQFRATNSIGNSPYSPSANATTDVTPTTTTTYEVRVKATASGFTDSAYAGPVTIDV